MFFNLNHFVSQQILTEMEYSGIGRNKEQSARMLGHLVSNAPRLIKPYMEPILRVRHSNNDFEKSLYFHFIMFGVKYSTISVDKQDTSIQKDNLGSAKAKYDKLSESSKNILMSNTSYY